jgi:hypothetical protein
MVEICHHITMTYKRCRFISTYTNMDRDDFTWKAKQTCRTWTRIPGQDADPDDFTYIWIHARAQHALNKCRKQKKN